MKSILLSGKKGDGQLLLLPLGLLLNLAMIAAIIVMLTTYIVTKTDFSYYAQLYLAEDIAFTLNSIPTLEGNLLYIYDHPAFPVHQYIFQIYSDKVKVLSEDRSIIAEYPYQQDDRYTLGTSELIGPGQIIFLKKGDQLTIGEDERKNLLTLSCKTHDSIDHNQVLIILTNELQVLKDNFIRTFPDIPIFTLKEFQDLKEYPKGKHLVLNLTTSVEGTNPLYAKISDSGGIAVTCSIINSLLESYPGEYTGANIMLVPQQTE